MAKETEGILFSTEEMNNMIKDSLQFQQNQPVVCLGREFPNDQARREYYREELRKKLPELRKIEGFPIGEDDDIINLSDPPYYTACPNPWLNDFIAEWEQQKEQLEAEGKRNADFEVKEPYASDVSEGKFDPLYMYHPYLTKVPYTAIMRYLNHYTQPGDIIFDGFAGTGMAGAASRLCNDTRKAICLDLSPLASFISYCVNNDMDATEFSKISKIIIERVKEEFSWMFKTLHTNGDYGDINYVLWSDVYTCPSCGHEIIYWHNAVDIEGGKILDSFACPKCGSLLSKASLEKMKETTFDNISSRPLLITKRLPVVISYTYRGKRYEKEPDEKDFEILCKIKDIKPEYWVPMDETYAGDELSRCYRDGIDYFYQYYTKRNLLALSRIKSLVGNHPIMNYLITKIAFQTTIMYRYTYMNGCWGAGGGPMSGTLYVPSLFKELNVFSQLSTLIDSRKKIPVAIENGSVITSTQSTLDSKNIADCTVDYIFTDPPFGKNFMYSEMNRLSEMWLKVHTNATDECIICNHQKKDFLQYQKLMYGAFKEYFRILKPGKWMSVEFSNTSAKVWTCIQNAIQNSGFVIANVSALDKKKGSFKAVTTTTAVKQDLVITCYKPSNKLTQSFLSIGGTKENVWNFIDEYLQHLPIHIEHGKVTTTVIERSPQILFDRLISYYVQNGYPIPLDAKDFQQGLAERYLEIDGMFFTAAQAAEYEEKKKAAPEFVPMGIIVSDENNGIQWLKNQLRDTPKTYQDIQPEWMQAINGLRKGDILPELKQLLEENFIEMEDGKWRLPNMQDDVDKDAMRTKSLLKEFKLYVETAKKTKAKIKEARVEALRAGFKQCYIDKDFQTIVQVGDKIPQNLRDEDEVLLQFYEIALNKI